MVSVSTTIIPATTMVLEKEEDYGLPPKILELRKKIQNQEYIDSAIQRIATVISGRLVENCDELKFNNFE